MFQNVFSFPIYLVYLALLSVDIVLTVREMINQSPNVSDGESFLMFEGKEVICSSVTMVIS